MAEEDELIIRAVLEDQMTRGMMELKEGIRDVSRTILQANAQQIASSEAVVKAIDNQHKALDRVVQQRSAMDRLNSSIGALEPTINRVTSAGLSMARMFSITVAGGAAAGTAAIAAFGVKSAAQIENLQLAFEGLTGSQQAGLDLFTKVQNLANVTPFTTQQQAQSTQMLMNYGIKDPNQLLKLETSLSDVSSATPMPAETLSAVSRALGQVYATGRLQGDEFNQLTNAQVPINDIVKQAYGIDNPKAFMDKGGVLDANKLIDAFSNMDVPALAGLKGFSDKQSKTLTGTYSTFQNELQQGAAREFSGTSDAIKTQLPGLGEDLAKGMATAAPGVASLTASMLTLADHAIPVLAPLLNTAAKDMSMFVDSIVPWLDREAEQGKINDALEKLGPILSEGGPALADFAGNMALLTTNLSTEGISVFTNFLQVANPFIGFLADLTRSGPAGKAAVDGIILGLVAFKSVSAVVGGITAVSKALDILAVSEAAASAAGGAGGVGGAAKGAAGLLGTAGKFAKGAGVVGLVGTAGYGMYESGKADNAAIGALGAAGSGALAGGAIGSVVPVLGTALGAGIGAGAGAAAYGVHKLFSSSGGDQPAPKSGFDNVLPPVNIQIGTVQSGVDIENAVHGGILKANRDKEERS